MIGSRSEQRASESVVCVASVNTGQLFCLPHPRSSAAEVDVPVAFVCSKLFRKFACEAKEYNGKQVLSLKVVARRLDPRASDHTFGMYEGGSPRKSTRA